MSARRIRVRSKERTRRLLATRGQAQDIDPRIGRIWVQRGFFPVRTSVHAWLNPQPMHEGERVLWADGSAHNWPETTSDEIVVLRRHPFPASRRRA